MNDEEEEIQYPSRRTIERWVEVLKQENNVFKVALPDTNNEWYGHILNVIERVKSSYSPNTLHRRAAELFYNTNKAHNYIDGNKRTSIVIVYLFYIINDKIVMKDLDVRDLAKKVAKSHGRSRHDEWIEKLEKGFEHCTGPLWTEESTAVDDSPDGATI